MLTSSNSSAKSPNGEIVVFKNTSEHLPKLEQADADNLIDMYLYMYTKGAELPFRDRNLLVEHKNESGDECRIIIDRQQKEPIYVVEFLDSQGKRGYYRMKNGEMQVEVNRQYLGLQEPDILLGEFEGFFGILDSEQLLASQFESVLYRNEVLFRKVGYFGSHGGGDTSFNIEAPEFYGGYKVSHMRTDAKTEVDVEQPEISASADMKQKSTFEATQRDIEQQATDIISVRQWPAISFEFVKTVLMGRIAGLTDKGIYRQLVMVYHPDQTALDIQQAEEIFKFMGQQFDKDAGSFGF